MTGASSKQAWERDWDKTLTAAKKERKVVIVGGYGVAVAKDPFISVMKEKFGIDADITVAQIPDLMQMIISQRRGGIFQNDIFLGGGKSLVGELFPRNFVQPIEPNLILPEVKNPALWFGGELPVWGPNREAFFSIIYITSHVSVNKNLVKPEEITSFNDLLKPKLKGLMAIWDPTQQGGGASFFNDAYTFMGVDYVKALLKQDLVLTRDLRQLTEWIVAGKYAVGIGGDGAPITSAIRDGFPVALLPVFKEGAIVGPGAGQLAVFNDPPHPNATKVFVNWLLSKEGMTTFAKAVGMASRRVDVPTDHLYEAMVPVTGAKYVWETQEVIEQYLKLQPLAKDIFGPLLK